MAERESGVASDDASQTESLNNCLEIKATFNKKISELFTEKEDTINSIVPGGVTHLRYNEPIVYRNGDLARE